jgi:tRNA G18 (ribose-2'-O)-methylase SpoU
MPEIILILHNIRSTYNVCAILRTAEAFGLKNILCTGYTPYPIINNDDRLPHIKNKLNDQISKSALGAEKMLNIEHDDELSLIDLKNQGYRVVGLEQNQNSIEISKYKVPEKLALLLGEEVSGISEENINLCDEIIEIPMHGTKESFNVSVAAGIALYALTTSK